MMFVLRLVSLVILPSLLLALPARADGIEVGTLLVCDTQQQVERFVALYDGDAQTAISAVNAEEHDPTACVVATIAYVLGSPLAQANNKNLTFHVVQVLVVGLFTPEGAQAVTPTRFFSIMVEEREAIDEREA